MNTYIKYCPNVWLAKCTEKHEKGAIIPVTNKYGKENDSVVFNLIGGSDGYYFYSIIRADGFNVQEWAKKRADRLIAAAANAEKQSNEQYQKSQEGREFLSLGEPIKTDHHSGKRHRALIDRNHKRMGKCVELSKKAEAYTQRSEYWEAKASEINLSMPESIEYYQYKLDRAKSIHADIKSGNVQKEHSFSLTYAKREVNEAEKNLKIAMKLWGDENIV